MFQHRIRPALILGFAAAMVLLTCICGTAQFRRGGPPMHVRPSYFYSYYRGPVRYGWYYPTYYGWSYFRRPGFRYAYSYGPLRFGWFYPTYYGWSYYRPSRYQPYLALALGTNPYLYGAAYPWYPPPPVSPAYPASRNLSTAPPAASPTLTSTPAAMPAALQVHVPEDAEVWIDGVKTDTKGAERLFETPPLSVGQTFTYEVRARWLEGGHEVSRVERAQVVTGTLLRIDFLATSGTSDQSKK